ncbi:hypothetical protein ACLMJK_008626 [Lecanora helva]
MDLADTRKDFVFEEWQSVCKNLLFWSRSSWFAAACKGNFKVSKPSFWERLWESSHLSKEATTQKIEFPEDNPSLIAKLVDYAYVLDYTDHEYAHKSNSEEHKFISALHTNAELYLLGEKYDLQGLKKLAGTKFDMAVAKLGTKPPEPSAMLSLVSIVCEGTPVKDRGLRDRVVSLALANLDTCGHKRI